MSWLGPPQLRRPRPSLLITPFTNRLNNYFKGKAPPLNVIVSQEINKIPQLMQTKNSITVFRKKKSPLISMLSIPVVARSGVALSLELRVSFPPDSCLPISCDCCVLSGRDICVGLITRPQESNRL